MKRMTRWLLIGAVMCMVPLLFMPMNVNVDRFAKMACWIAAGALLLLAAINHLRSHR